MGEKKKEVRLIAFRVGPETFVLDIMAVRQIMPYRGSTSIPTAPAFVAGIISLKNELVPVVDLRERLYPHLEERTDQPLVLVATTSIGTIGLRVDEVRRIVTVGAEELLPPPGLVHGVRGELLIAVIRQGEELLLLIDLDSVLTVDEKRELQSADLSSSAPPAGTSERSSRRKP